MDNVGFKNINAMLIIQLAITAVRNIIYFSVTVKLSANIVLFFLWICLYLLYFFLYFILLYHPANTNVFRHSLLLAYLDIFQVRAKTVFHQGSRISLLSPRGNLLYSQKSTHKVTRNIRQALY